MKKIVLLFIVLSFALSAQAAEIKIAYVDLNKAMSESERGKNAMSELENMGKSLEQAVEEKRIEIKNLEQEIIKQASILNPESIKDKQDKLDTLKKEFQKTIKESQETFDKKRAELTRSLLGELGKIVSKIGEDEGYTLILEKMQSGIIYVPDNLNITDEVIKRFNKASKEPEKK